MKYIGLLLAILFTIDMAFKYNLPVRRPDIKVTTPDGRQGMIVDYYLFGWLSVNVPANKDEAEPWHFDNGNIPRHWITCHRWSLK